MTHRFYVYPLLLLAGLQLGLMARSRGDDGWRWHLAQLAHWLLVLLAAAAAALFSETIHWVIVAWSLFGLFILAPSAGLRLAKRCQALGHWRCAARAHRFVGLLIWGPLGELHRKYATTLELVARDQHSAAIKLLDDVAAEPMPAGPRGTVRFWKLSVLAATRDWPAVAAEYEQVDEWGTLATATQARLIAANAYAETGHFDRALRCLQFVMLSPRTITSVLTQLWFTQVSVAALAGDADEVESLLARHDRPMRRRFDRFAAYWRGRCALARGERDAGLHRLQEALALTPIRDTLWLDVITDELHRLERSSSSPPSGSAEGPATFAAQTEEYFHGREMLRHAETQAVRWRDLVAWGRPDAATLGLLLAFATVYALTALVSGEAGQEWIELHAGNIPALVHGGEWWRLVTALFVHANALHLLMNGLTLWMFGAAVEKTMGWWRLLVIFILAGVAGNFLSATVARYDVSVGASGGIFGLIGAFAVAVYRLRLPIYAAVRRRLLTVLALTVLGDFAIGSWEPNLDNLAHVGGFFVGLALAVLLDRPGRADPQMRGQGRARSL